MAASLPASVSIANGARAIAPAPHQPINGENISRCSQEWQNSSALVKSPSREGNASAVRISASTSALVGPRETRAAGAALTYSTPRLCALLMTERCDTLANSSANALALARLRGAASRMRCSIALV